MYILPDPLSTPLVPLDALLSVLYIMYMPRTPNPLVTARVAARLTQAELAARMGVAQQFVSWCELGCYNQIIPSYRIHFPELNTDEAQQAYRLFQYEKRNDNFDPQNFPTADRRFRSILEALRLTPYGFATKACVQVAETQRLLRAKRCYVPTSFIEFFNDINLPQEWINGFARTYAA